MREVLGPGARLVAIEAEKDPAQVATAFFDDVVTGYFPACLSDEVLRGERFDLVVFNDVLEHMVDPWSALHAAHSVLTESGVVLASVPNIQYAPVVESLIRGGFDYADSGVLDRTHLRFFTRKTLLEMFAGAGFEVARCAGIHSAWEYWDSLPRGRRVVGPLLRRAKRGIRRTALRALPDSEWTQFVVVARPAVDRDASGSEVGRS